MVLENNAFSLKNIGDISVPFKTEYGWHIITLLEKQVIPLFEDVKLDLKRKIERDSRGELSKKALFKKLHSTYKVVNKPSTYSAFRKGAANKVETATFEKSDNKTI